MNKELYDKLKKLMVKVNAEGYRLEVQYGSIYLFKEDSRDLKSRVCMYLHRERLQGDILRLTFTSDICSMPGGNNYSTIEESRVVVKHWGHLLNLCEYLNELNIAGNPLEMMNMIETIKRRERR